MSTTVEQLLDQCEQRDIHLRVEDGNIIFRCPPGAMHPEFRERLRGYRPELIRYLSKLRIVSSNDHADPHGRKRSVRVYRVQVDNKSLIAIDNAQTDNFRALMVRKFGVGRVGTIHELTRKLNSGDQLTGIEIH